MEVGTLKIDFAEGNAINMEINAVPMTDSAGINSKSVTTPYTFTITNGGDIK